MFANFFAKQHRSSKDLSSTTLSVRCSHWYYLPSYLGSSAYVCCMVSGTQLQLIWYAIGKLGVVLKEEDWLTCVILLQDDRVVFRLARMMKSIKNTACQALHQSKVSDASCSLTHISIFVWMQHIGPGYNVWSIFAQELFVCVEQSQRTWAGQNALHECFELGCLLKTSTNFCD